MSSGKKTRLYYHESPEYQAEQARVQRVKTEAEQAGKRRHRQATAPDTRTALTPPNLRFEAAERQLEAQGRLESDLMPAMPVPAQPKPQPKPILESHAMPQAVLDERYGGNGWASNGRGDWFIPDRGSRSHDHYVQRQADLQAQGWVNIGSRKYLEPPPKGHEAYQRYQDLQAEPTRALSINPGQLGTQVLDPRVQAQLESVLGRLPTIQIASGRDADQQSQAISAVAFTSGSTIAFRYGKFDPTTLEGFKLLLHEATHVKQQSSGQVSGGGIDPDQSLELQAQQQADDLSQIPEIPQISHLEGKNVSWDQHVAHYSKQLIDRHDDLGPTKDRFSQMQDFFWQIPDDYQARSRFNLISGFNTMSHEANELSHHLRTFRAGGLEWKEQLEGERNAKLEQQKAISDTRAATSFQSEVPRVVAPHVNTHFIGPSAQTTNASQTRSSSLQRAPEATAPNSDPKGTKLNTRGAAFNEKYPVKLRSSMDTKAESNVVTKISFGTTFLITEQIGTWYKIKLDSGQIGFVAAENISVAPDPKSEFYKIQSGDNAIDIVAKRFNAKIGMDLRFYVGVLAKLNPRSIKMPEGIDWSKDESVMAWKKANPMVGFYIWIPSQAYAKSLAGQVNNGRLQDHKVAAATEIGKGIVQKTIKDLGGAEVIKQLQSIGSNVQLIWDNPGAFMANLQKAFEGGFHNFQNNFDKHLKGGVMDWLGGAMGTSFQIPSKLDSAGYTSIGLQVLGLDYQRNLRPLLVANLGASGVTQLETGGTVLTEVVKTRSLNPVLSYVQSQGQALNDMAADLPKMILDGLKGFAINAIITKAIPKLLSMIIPGGGLVQAAINIYNAVMFMIERAKQIGRFIGNLTSSFAAIAKGDLPKAIEKVEAVLKNGLSLSLGFLASIAGLTKVANGIKAALAKIQKPVKDILGKIAVWFKGQFSRLMASVKPQAGAKPQTTPKPGEQTNQAGAPKTLELPFDMNGAAHTLYVALGSSAAVEMASKKDRISNKIGRAVAAILQSGAKEDDPRVVELKKIGKTASDVQKRAKAATPSSAVTAASLGFTKLAAEIRVFGKKHNVTDIDGNILGEKTLQGGSRIVNVRGQKWNLPVGKTEQDIPKVDPIGDALLGSAQKYGGQWSLSELSDKEAANIKDAEEKAKKDGSWYQVNRLKNQAKGRWVEGRVRADFSNLTWSKRGVDVADIKTGLNYDILLGSQWNIDKHAKRMLHIMFRYITF